MKVENPIIAALKVLVKRLIGLLAKREATKISAAPSSTATSPP